MHEINGFSYSSHSEIAIAYANLDSFQNISHLYPHIVNKISIVHSKLQSLRGIQKFTQITHLNLKFNNLEHAEELMRIPNRAILRQLNLQGNCIQYYAQCTFLALKRHGFDSLVMLNNKDYTKWNKRKQKQPNIQKINAKVAQIQKSMSKTLKRTIKTNILQKYKISNQIEQDENLYEQQETSREPSRQQTGSSHERTPIHEISVGNANVRISVKQQEHPNQKSKIRQLQIDPFEFGDDQIVHMPLTQPTATFASQKQKDCMPFKGRNHFSNEINVVSEEVDNFTSEDEQNQYEISYFTNNGTRQSYSRARKMGGNHNKSAIQQMYDEAQEMQKRIADGFYKSNLLVKTLRAIKLYRLSCNLPRKIHYV